MLRHVAAAAALVVVSLAAESAGYEHFEGMAWLSRLPQHGDRSAGGIGPVDAPHTDGGKVFAGLYALYSGIVFIATATLLLAPVVHRVMHKFHWKRDQ